MSVKIHPNGGFILTKSMPGGLMETRISWRQHVDGMAIEIIGGGNSTALVTMLIDLLGGGLNVEFDQSLLIASSECPPSTDGYVTRKLAKTLFDIAAKLGVDMPEGDIPLDDVVKRIHAEIDGAHAAELLPLDQSVGKSPFGVGPSEPLPTHSDPLLTETKPTIAGVQVGEAQPGDTAEQKRRKRRTRAEIEADNAREAAANESARQAAIAAANEKMGVKGATSAEEAFAKTVGQSGLAKAGTVPAQPTPPNAENTAAFTAEMKAIEDKLPPATTVPLKPPSPAAAEETRVIPIEDELDESMLLLTDPPMPVDLDPLTAKRQPSDWQFADTAYMRLLYGYFLGEEYAKDPKFKPQQPPQPKVGLKSDEGVVAFVQWLHAIYLRSVERKVQIPQLDLFFSLGTLEEVIESAVHKIRARREAAAAQQAR